MAAQSQQPNKKLYELNGQFHCSRSDLYIQLSISCSLSMTVKLWSLRAEKDPRYHFIDDKIEVYNNSDVQQKFKILKDPGTYRYLSVLTIC